MLDNRSQGSDESNSGVYICIHFEVCTTPLLAASSVFIIGLEFEVKTKSEIETVMDLKGMKWIKVDLKHSSLMFFVAVGKNRF